MQEIWIEVTAIARALFLGILLRAGYDGIRLFRTMIHHNKIAEAIEDFFYWVTTAFLIFSLLYHTFDGALRGVIILCVFVGMLLCASIDKKVEQYCRKPLKLFKKKVIMSSPCLKGEKGNVRHKKHPKENSKKSKAKKKD